MRLNITRSRFDPAGREFLTTASRTRARAAPDHRKRIRNIDAPQRFTYSSALSWGHSSAGRARQWHCRGHRFDPDWLHQVLKVLACKVSASPSSRGLGHRPFTAVTGVRIPLGTPHILPTDSEGSKKTPESPGFFIFGVTIRADAFRRNMPPPGGIFGASEKVYKADAPKSLTGVYRYAAQRPHLQDDPAARRDLSPLRRLGLYLEVMPNGSKYWRLKYRFIRGLEKETPATQGDLERLLRQMQSPAVLRALSAVRKA